jgi:N-acetylglucosamine malate deacetylase 1
LTARVLVLAAHPDDAEIFAGGLIARHCRLGNPVKIISVTDGRSGHHQIEPHDLVGIRRAEAHAAGERIGAQYLTWDFPDGRLEPSIEVRESIIREIRSFRPDLVLTHRPYDYHPDHRAVGVAVQDASYLVTVPHICSDTPVIKQSPVVASMVDLFNKPCPMQADVVLEISREMDAVVQMTGCHQSQVFEWLPTHDGLHVPEDPSERLIWLADWMLELHRQRRQHFAKELVARGLPLDEDVLVEVYEISEYAGQPDAEQMPNLFPGFLAAAR